MRCSCGSVFPSVFSVFSLVYGLLVHCSCDSVFPSVFPVFSLVYDLLVRCWSVVCILLWLVFAGYFGSVIHRGLLIRLLNTYCESVFPVMTVVGYPSLCRISTGLLYPRCVSYNVM